MSITITNVWYDVQYNTIFFTKLRYICRLYTSDAADEEDSVDLGGRRIIKKKKKKTNTKKKKTTTTR